MADRADSMENRRLAAHCAILQANEAGGPSGQSLRESQPGTPQPGTPQPGTPQPGPSQPGPSGVDEVDKSRKRVSFAYFCNQVFIET